jgi:hypothetical protein
MDMLWEAMLSKKSIFRRLLLMEAKQLRGRTGRGAKECQRRRRKRRRINISISFDGISKSI